MLLLPRLFSTSSLDAKAQTSLRAAAALATGPTAWRGPDLAARPSDWVTELNAEEVLELEAAVDASASVPIAEITASTCPLPTLSTKLRNIKHNLLSGPGIALLRNLPTEAWGVERSARAFWLLGLHLGETRPVPQNKQGHLLGHVFDLGTDPSKPETRIYTTSIAQPYHTDSADIVGLMCLRPAARGGESQVVSSHAVFSELAETRPDLAAELLHTPTYWDRKGEIPEGAEPWFPVRAFAVAGGERLCAGLFDRSFVDAAQRRFSTADGVPRLRPLLREALDEAERLAADPRLVLRMTLRSGDVQFIHSHQTWHARSGFEDDAEAPRHLLRLWLCPGEGDAWPLPTEYAARYGTLEVGGAVPRGGVRCPGVQPFVPLTPRG